MQDDINRQIRRVNNGEPGAQDALFAAAYGELCRLARSRLRQGGRCGELDTQMVVHESYLRFISGGALRGDTRGAFFAYASTIMRSVIIDTVRSQRSDRRGGSSQHMTFDTQVADATPAGEDELIWVHDALDVLAKAEPRLAKVVEMRYFGGYSEVEIGDVLQINARTVRRDWDKARLLLSTMLKH